jgi:hypothetical protein
MLRGLRIDRAQRRRVILALGLLVAGEVIAAGAESACRSPQQAMQQIELMFGRNIGGRLGVSETAWSRFLAREVTPRFPDGLTVVNAASQWRDKEHGALVREPSKLVRLSHARQDRRHRCGVQATIPPAIRRSDHPSGVRRVLGTGGRTLGSASA